MVDLIRECHRLAQNPFLKCDVFPKDIDILIHQVSSRNACTRRIVYVSRAKHGVPTSTRKRSDTSSIQTVRATL
jgi:hypothetical protein